MDSQIQHSNPIQYVEDNDDNVILYISDIHIRSNATDKKIERIVLKLRDSIPNYRNKKIFFIGDICDTIDTFERFFNKYRVYIDTQTFFVLGNHELHETTQETLQKTIDAYRSIIEESGGGTYRLLDNQLYVEGFCRREVINAEQIIKMSTDEVLKLFSTSRFFVLGGTGFIGGKYVGSSLIGIKKFMKEEIRKAEEFREIYAKLQEIVPDKKVFVVTHIPKIEWIHPNDREIIMNKSKYIQWKSTGCNRTWTYFSGHDHFNYYEEGDRHIYADNQVGYREDSIEFKYIATNPFYNIFETYDDGIYEINNYQYKEFYYRLGLRSIHANMDYKIILLKRCDTYCFITKNKNGDLILLNGGCRKKLTKKDINYYYNNLEQYSRILKEYIGNYSNLQEQIANEVKSFGGLGTIHGCIIDIDFYNHIYVNPLDGKITPYYAENIIEKYVHKNVISLLYYHNKLLYNNYEKILKKKSLKQAESLVLQKNEITRTCIEERDTYIYKVSRIIKGLQYTSNYNIVRLWNDNLLEKNLKGTAGRLILESLLSESDSRNSIKKTKEDIVVKRNYEGKFNKVTFDHRKAKNTGETDEGFLNRIRLKPIDELTVYELRRYAKICLQKQ